MKTLLFLSILVNTLWVGAQTYTLTWQWNALDSIHNQEYNLSTLWENTMQQYSSDKLEFYEDVTCKKQVQPDTLYQIWSKNQISMYSYGILQVTEVWKETPKGIQSNVQQIGFLLSQPINITYKTLYLNPKNSQKMIQQTSISGDCKGIANVPLTEYLKKHAFDYKIIQKPENFSMKPNLKFIYNDEAEQRKDKKFELLFDYFPAKNQVFGHTYQRTPDLEEQFHLLSRYNCPVVNEVLRKEWITFITQKKLWIKTKNWESLLEQPCNFIVYLEGVQNVTQTTYTRMRVYLTNGKLSETPNSLCAELNAKAMRSLEKFTQKRANIDLNTVFKENKVDFLVAYINGTYAKNVEEGINLRKMMFGK